MAAEQETNIKFVQEIEKHACLYNYKLPEYMRKNIIDKTWAEIGNKFQITGSEAKEKWKNLRSVFVRHLKPAKSGAGTAQKKPYYLADYMQFTVPFIKTAGKPSGNLKETIEPQTPDIELREQTQFTENVPTSTQPISQQQSSLPSTSTNTQPISQQQSSLPSTSTSTQPISQQQSSLPSTSTSTQPISQQQLPPPPPSTNNKKKRKKLEETQAEQDISAYFKFKQSKILENCDSTENSNKMFLLSLLSDVNKMTDSQRRLFKRRVLALIDDIMDQSSENMNSPITLYSTPSPMSSAEVISTPITINESLNVVQSNTASLYYESIPMLLSQEDEE
ncbi:A-agglutinin anchorage subunit-like [Pieris napi]|uniref:A-agglutinin anchorage subunit-like n=1 Tax=Pieris napi TaxID=78633 RepID=UPI001FBABA13|nr:A-agglutinin anchorage subunit-like [Pieris napi]